MRSLCVAVFVTVLNTLCFGSESDGTNIRHDFPYASKKVQVKGAKMHYADSEGEGDPILLVHGIPTWSYLWRNVMPGLEDRGRVLAVDLIGFGKSDKPGVGYKLADQAAYFEAFVKAMELKDITLVLHDMGSFVGLHYATEHPENVKAIVVMESMLTLDTWENMPKETAEFMKAIRDDKFARQWIVEKNNAIEETIPYLTKRDLSKSEMDAYRMPFLTKDSREKQVPLWMDFPISGEPREPHEMQVKYIDSLKQSKVPKLMLTISKPIVGTTQQIQWVKSNLQNTTIVDVGEGRHFMQEDQPKKISIAISDWMVENDL